MPEATQRDSVLLKPTAELAPRVLVPGDPQRALATAQELLEDPLPFNLQRGLWGYTGRAPDGKPLTIQSTGMGGPSAAIVVEELARLGARTLLRIGTCGSLVAGIELGDLVTATEVIGADGTSRALGAPERQPTDRALAEALLAAGGGMAATIVTTDVFYEEREGLEREWTEAGAAAVEMEAATVLAVAARHGATAGCLLAVTDQLAGGGRRRMSDEGIEAVGLELGRVAVTALTG